MSGTELTPEQVGFQIFAISTSVIFATIAGYAISMMFIIPATSSISQPVVAIIIGIITTTILPKRIYGYLKPYILQSWSVARSPSIKKRGEGDREMVGVSVLIILMGTFAFAYAPYAISGEPAFISDILISGSPDLMRVVEIAYMNIAVCGTLMVVIGGVLIGWFRVTYPRSCGSCGNRRDLSGEYCSKCSASLSHVPSRTENLKTLIRGERGDEQTKLSDWD